MRSEDIWIIKIGGSLLTDKTKYKTPNLSGLTKWASAIAAVWSELRGHLVLIIGGGSFGSGSIVRYRERGERDIDLASTVECMYAFATQFSELLCSRGVATYPFQTSACLVTKSGQPFRFMHEAIALALQRGLLPTLWGALVLDIDRGLEVFGSDFLPVVLAKSLPVRRVVYFTDVPGVMREVHGAEEIVSTLSSEAALMLENSDLKDSSHDLTGGMLEKVKASLLLSTQGVDSVICDGRTTDSLMSALMNKRPPGTFCPGVKLGPSASILRQRSAPNTRRGG